MKIGALVLGIAFAASVIAQEAPTAKLKLPAKVVAGSLVKGTLVLKFSDGWHGYQNPPLDPYQNPVTLLLENKWLKLKNVAYPTGVIKEFQGAKAAVYEGEVEIPFEFVAPKRTGKLDLPFRLAYQQCNESTCLPPASLSLKGSLTLVKAAPNGAQKGGR